MIRETRDELHLFCFEGVDPIRLDAFRRTFAATFLIYMVFRFRYASEWLTDCGFHLTVDIASYYEPPPLPTMPEWCVPLFGVLLFGSTGCLIVGYRIKLMTWLVFGCAFYATHVDAVAAFTLNRLYVLGFFVLAVSPPKRPVTFNSGESLVLQSVWPIRIIQATLLIQYFTAGTCKIFHGDWNWYHPDILWGHVQGGYRTDLAAVLLNSLPKSAWTVMLWGGLGFELLAPLLFTNKRLIPIGIIWGIGFHVSIALLMKSLIYFSAQMMSFYILFLSPQALHSLQSLLNRLRRPP